ncbi:MAG TPA: DUF2249 domain-containing protein [Nitrospirae bacterium]|nr:DUF2249 domain-containing protein [Nitrospirota bacterium]HDK81879.1 DUF2249 domain-containing protein [Nitrospirota bacterium]
MADIKPDKVLDVRGLKCPMPLVKVRQSLRNMHSGEVLEIVADDITTKSTFAAYLKHSGDELLELDEAGEEIRYYIRKK